MQPGRGVVCRGRVQTVEVDEDLLGHVLRLVSVREDAVGDADDARVLGCEEGFERRLVSVDGGHPARTDVHGHYTSSTTDSPNMTSACEGFASSRAPGDLVLDDPEVRPRQGVDVALEGERPVLGRPLAHVVEPVGDLLRRDPVRLLEDEVGSYVDPPRIVLIAA